METCYNNPSRDSLLLLKERIIKAEILLNKYACLSKKFNDLEVSHSHAIENEKRAKKDAARYLEKYCKLTKKCNYLTNKINTLEETIKRQVNELEEYQNEFVKLESVIQIYKTERKGHQGLKRDKDFLLTHLWKLLKKSEGAQDFKIRKLGETFFNKFEKDLAELKLEDFRKLQLKNRSRSLEFHETTEMTYSSPNSQLIDSDESDLVESDLPSKIENLSALKLNCVVEKVTNSVSIGRRNSPGMDTESIKNNISLVQEIKVLKNSPATVTEPFTSEENENLRSTKVNKNCEIVQNIKSMDNSRFNENKNGNISGSLVNLDNATSPTTINSFSDEADENSNLEAMPHKEVAVIQKEQSSEVNVKHKIPGKFNRTYRSRKCMSLSGKCSTNAVEKPDGISCSGNQSKVEIPPYNNEIISEGTNSFTLPDLNCSNSSSEIISLDIDDNVGDVKNLPEHGRYYEKISDSVVNLEDQSELRDSSNESSVSLLFLMENNLMDYEPEISADNSKESSSKPTLNVSIFDIQDTDNAVKSTKNTFEEIQDTCVEFTSNNRHMIALNEEIKSSISEKYTSRDQVEPYKALNKKKNINVLRNDKPKNNLNINERLVENGTGPEDNSICNTSQSRLAKSDSNESISDDEIFKILKSVTPVRLLSPLKDKEPVNRDILINNQSLLKKKSAIVDDIQLENSTNNISKNMVISKADNPIEEPSKSTESIVLENEKMINKFVQTLEPLRADKGCQKSGKYKKAILSKSIIRKICSIIWKRNLKFACVNHFANYMKSHSSCFSFLKMMFGMLKCHKLQHCTKTEKKLNNLLLKERRKNKNRIQILKKKSSWQVNDVELTELNCNEIKDSFNSSIDKTNNFLRHIPNFHNSDNTIISNYTIRSKEVGVPENKSFFWLTPSLELDFGNQKSKQSKVDGKKCEGNFSWEQKIDADINFQHDVVVDNFKKESEGFSKADTEVKCLDDSLCAKIECRGVKEKVSNTEFYALKSEREQFEAYREVGNAEIIPAKKMERTEKSLPRRSPRIQNRNMLISNKITLDNKASVISPNETKLDSESLSDSNEFITKLSLNETGSCRKLKQKFEDLFGEPELHFETSESGDESENILGEAPKQHAKESTKKFMVGSQTDNKKHGMIKRMKPGLCHINTQQTKNIPKSKRLNLVIPEESKTETNEVDTTYKTNDDTSFLDSIMTAMTKQTEEFKVKLPIREAEIINNSGYRNNIQTLENPLKDCNCKAPVQNKISKEYEMKGNDSAFLNLSYSWNLRNNSGNQIFKENSELNKICERNSSEERKIKDLVQKEISNFVKMDINSVEEGQEKMKSCITVLENAGENTVASAIVSEIMANVDEELQEFDRPAPPLTRTQHRIMIILACLSKSSEENNGISYKILKIIWSKLFPENFFWPDDSVEMASRFYAALCKRLNDFKGIWKFCFKAISCMRQRWCLPIFVVFQVWPDILHNAHEIQDNILVNTFVNIILHTPKTEEMRRKRQEQKLLAIKHLLINFYNFDNNSTIEGFTQQLLESYLQNVPGSLDALVLLSKCRKWAWTRKNVIAKLLETLDAWLSGNISDITGLKTLDIIHKITHIFPAADSTMAPSVENIISTLSKILSSENLKQSSEEKVIKILCSLGHYSSVKDILNRLSGKFSSDGLIYLEIKRALNVSNKKGKGRSMNMNMKKNTKRYIAKKKIKQKGKRKTKKKNSSQKKVLGTAKPNEQTLD